MAQLKNTTISTGNASGNLRIPSGTIANRPGSPVAGSMRFNTQKGVVETFVGSAWDNNSSWIVNNSFRTSPTYTPRVLMQVESASGNNGSPGTRQFIQINGTTVVDAGAPRSYRVTKLIKSPTNGQWQLSATNGYDVYGDVNQANALLAYLQTFREGEMLILNTADEPNQNRTVFADYLRDNFASNIRGYEYQWNFRDLHLLVSFRGAAAPLFEEHKPSPEAGSNVSIWLP